MSRDSEDERRILQNQVDNLRAYCSRIGLSLTEANEFVEIVSGGKDDRPELNRLLAAASLQRGRPFDVVVFTSLSRMTRGGIGSALYILDRLAASKVSWHFVDQPLLNFDSNTPKLAKDIILSVLAAVDADYRDRISKATRAAYQSRVNLAAGSGTTVRWGRHKKTCVCERCAKRRGEMGSPPLHSRPGSAKEIGAISPTATQPLSALRT
ncbi:MAG: recombinase family protein [Thermoplasmata archaeon]|nr:recombinase family protein [Thermoplasmata archaeon]